ncbi:MAG: response regulator transcription factor [Rhodospirillaceae bacterium]|nr:response regulator transcription factor [Rhodospirillales bacterium]
MAQSFENVRLVIADPNPVVRTGLRGALFSIGFRTISDTASFIKLHDLIEQDAIDLLVTSSELENNDVGFLISEMRSQRLGPNPFLVVITLLTSADPDYVKRVIDSGSDDLLLTPVQPDQLILRIEKLARTRKPFVVTHDYTGPDRRTKARAFETHSAPMLEVPNPLKVRADSGMDGTRLSRMVAETSITLNRMKIERHAVQIDWLVNHIHASIRDGISADPMVLLPYISKLPLAAEDMIRRMTGHPSEIYIPPVTELLELSKKLEADPANMPFTALERLAALSKLISKSLGTPPAPCAPAP